MLFRLLKSEGLAHNSYYVSAGGEAMVIDPRRDIDAYLELARYNQDRIRYILETHCNEDYVIGSTALQAASGAQILHGSAIDFEYGSPMREGDEIGVGRLRVRALETPGHTDESMSYALVDTETSGDPVMVFTGDALFIGATGRVDLYGPDEKERLAEQLHRSLFEKILPLGDQVMLFPAHGAGSVCGSGMVDRDLSTLGVERLFNESLKLREREKFVSSKVDEKHVRPPYFARMEEYNRRGNAPIFERLPRPPPLSPGEFAERVHAGALIVDTRMPQAFAAGHIPGSYNIWLDGLPGYLGWIAPLDAEILFVLPDHAEQKKAVLHAFRTGYDEIGGYLRGGFESWQNEGREVGRHGTMDTHELRRRLDSGEKVTVLDVRKPDEWEEGSIDGAEKIFVGELEQKLDRIPRDQTLVAMCSVGHRGGLAASILARHGFRDVYNYLGGFTAWSRGPSARS